MPRWRSLKLLLRNLDWPLVAILGAVITTTSCSSQNASIGVAIPLRWGGRDSPIEDSFIRFAASAAMAAEHVNQRVPTLVPRAQQLLPSGFKLVFDVQDTMAQPTTAVERAVEWNRQGMHAIVGSLRSAVTGPLALAASIEATPVIAWAATASSLSDRATYPTFSRTVVNDAVLAASMIKAIRAMGWTRIAILYVNDAWGRGFFEEAASAAPGAGVEVVVAARYDLGAEGYIERALQEIAASEAKVVLCFAFDADLGYIAAAAEHLGLLSSGHAWILNQNAVNDVVSSSDEPTTTQRQLTGWLEVVLDPMAGGRLESFQAALEDEPLGSLNSGVMTGWVTEQVIAGAPCDIYCGTIYDAVWTAAIAIGRVGVEDDGSVDKAALLGAIRNVTFEGATGRVQFDAETGERDPDSMPLLLRNVQEVTAPDGALSLSKVVVWQWEPGPDGRGQLVRQGNSTPVWPGGARAWTLPFEEVACAAGSVFSSSSLQCEPCPAGTAKVEEECVRYDAFIGVLVPLRWCTPEAAIQVSSARLAAAALMAVQHVNNRVGSLVPRAQDLLPAGFRLVCDLEDSLGLSSVAVTRTVEWNEEGRHVIIGSERSDVSRALALASSIADTPVISYAASADGLSDRTTYPTFGRTVVSDSVEADRAVSAISAMGFSRVAVLYTDTSFGRSYAQSLVSSAGKAGVEIETSAAVDDDTVDAAVARVAQGGARIIIGVLLDSDLEAVVSAADSLGLLNTGCAWFIRDHRDVESVIAAGTDPAWVRARLSGWMTFALEHMYGARQEAFDQVLQTEPIEHLAHPGLDGMLTPTVLEGDCLHCGLVYDAVWTAAIAIGRVGVEDDGSVDKAALLGAIRNVTFEGATGRVQFDAETGERDAGAVPLIIRNLRPVAAPNGSVHLASVASWKTFGAALSQESIDPPVWPGGVQQWQLPTAAAVCPDGFAFSSSSLQCEPCPAGTAAEGDACVRFDAFIGVLVPLRWGGVDSPMEPPFLHYAASASMAVQHINDRVSSLVPHATELLPAGFKLAYELQDSMATPSVAVDHVVAWNRQDRHAVVGSYRSAVTGPVALAASIAATPVITWGSTASTLTDRDTYPTLSRTVVDDSVLAARTIQAIRAMGWTRIAIVYVDDAWGRGFARDAASEATALGIHVEASAGFTIGVRTEMEKAVQQVALSGVKVTLAVVFDADIALLAEIADSLGLLQPGYAWVSGGERAVESAAILSADPTETRRRLSGWMLATLDALDGGRGQRFQLALEQQPVEHLRHGVVADALTREVLSSTPCDQFCALIYDAVWTAAIAIGRVGVEDDGSVDKAALLGAIRNVTFEGATGRVQFDAETGERDPDSMPLLLRNVQEVTAQEDVSALEVLSTWRLEPGPDGRGQLVRQGNSTPVWPGGARAWTLPFEEVACAAGSVFSSSSLQCEPCPAGTAKVEEECVRYDAFIGVLVPLRWNGATEPMWEWTMLHMAAAVMAVQHINDRVSSLVPHATELLPAGFKLAYELQDSMATPSVAVDHVVEWNARGVHAVIGSLRSAVTAPVALAASIAATPVITWGSTASTLTDKATYPSLGRTVISDGILSASTIRAMGALGWTRIAVMYVDDAWGRSMGQDLSSAAAEFDMEIMSTTAFSLGDPASIHEAVAFIAASGVRVVVLVAFDSDLTAIADAADENAMLRPGFAWVLTSGNSIENAVASSPNPEKTKAQLVGWLISFFDPYYGERGSVFQSTFARESLDDLNHAVFAGELTEEVLDSNACDQFCALIYDAVWTAAIAIGRVGVEDDGSVDKAALLGAIRNVTFEGATGRVQFDAETGERDPRSQPLLLLNVRPTTRRAENPVAVLTWQWWADGGDLGRLEQLSSEAPFWPGGAQEWDAPADTVSCPRGSVLQPGTSLCQPCPPGTRLVGARCEQCEPGTIASEAGAVECSKCQVGYANESGMTACHACPANTVRSAASPGINRSECLCVVGTYSLGGPGDECRQCRTGAVCPGGAQGPYPLEGFWGDPSCWRNGGNKSCVEWDSFIACNPADNCRGGENFSCSPGRTGLLCMEIADGWSNVGGVFFWRCGRHGELITLAGFVGVILVWFGINSIASGQFVALNIALLFVQITALIGAYGLKWHTRLHGINLVLGVANFDVDFLAASCLFPWGPVRSLNFQLALPFLFGLAYGLFFLSKELLSTWRDTTGERRLRWKRLFASTQKKFVSFVIINYTTLALKSLQPFRCSRFPDGSSHMAFAPSIECWSGEHWVMVSLSLLYIFVVLLGLPCWIWLTLRHHIKHGTLHDVDIERQWGFVHAAYEPDWKWWECVLLLRRALIAFIAVLVPEPMLQGAATLVVLAVNLSAQVFTAPFIRSDIDVLDFLAICGSMLYCLSGILMYPSVTQHAQGHLCSESSDSEFCAADGSIKNSVSILAATIIALMVFVSSVLTFRSVREHRASALAAKKIRRHLQGSFRRDSSEVLQQVAVSCNRVSLDEILQGELLLKWTKRLQNHKHAMKFRASAMQFLMVEDGLLEIQEDLSTSATTALADVMRRLCEIPGFADYLLAEDAVGVQAFNTFVHNLATFKQRTEDMGRRFLADRVIRFEHRPLLCWWLSETDEGKRRTCSQLVDAILRANKLTSNPEVDGRDTPFSATSSPAGTTSLRRPLRTCSDTDGETSTKPASPEASPDRLHASSLYVDLAAGQDPTPQATISVAADAPDGAEHQLRDLALSISLAPSMSRGAALQNRAASLWSPSNGTVLAPSVLSQYEELQSQRPPSPLLAVDGEDRAAGVQEGGGHG